MVLGTGRSEYIPEEVAPEEMNKTITKENYDLSVLLYN